MSLHDLDELVLQTRNRTSRIYIQEAIAGYHIGTLRAATVSTWIAVNYDIISKIRQLSNHGDSQARQFIESLDKAIQSESTRALEKIESGILNTAAEFELLDSQQLRDLSRLKDDRNYAAHPAFVNATHLFDPTSEAVRSHIVHALLYLLTQRAGQGKALIEQFKADVIADSFPSDVGRLREFLNDKYLKNSRESLSKALIEKILWWLIYQGDSELIGYETRLAHSFASFADLLPITFMHYVKGWISDGKQLSDAELVNILWLMVAGPQIWNELDAHVQIQIRTLVEQMPLTPALYGGVYIDELRPVIEKKLEDSPPDEKATVVSDFWVAEIGDCIASWYGAARGWREAENLGQNVVLPALSRMTDEQICRVLEKVPGNSQIWDAAGTQNILAEAYQIVRKRTGLRKEWQKLYESLPNKKLYDRLTRLLDEDGVIDEKP